MKPSRVCNLQFLRVDWMMVGLLMGVSLSLIGCSTQGLPDTENSGKDESPVLAFVQVAPKGPYFRKHQTEAMIRFFDVKNIGTGERVRLTVESNTSRLVASLAPGEYELFRVQIGEGPFRSEALVEMTFQVYAEKISYLGTWHFVIDPPKTVRMLQWEILGESSDRDLVRASNSEYDYKHIVFSLPKPLITKVRLFAVAPMQPRSKYFYRR